MSLLHAFVALIVAALCVYLIVALLKPEWFE